MKTNYPLNANLFYSPRLFEGENDVVCSVLDEAVTKRKNDWILFFNEYESNAFCFYEKTINVLTQMFETNNLIKEQTAFEFELSKAFYCQLFELKKNKILSTEIAAHKLLMLSLIFGKYPGMFRISISNYFRDCDQLLNEQLINQFFKETLVRYELPHYLIQNFQHLNREELELLIYALKGKNLRKHPVFNVLPTKNEFTQLMRLKADFLTVNNNLFIRGLIYLKIRTLEDEEASDEFITNESALITSFLKASPTFLNKPKKYLEDIQFWKKAFELVLNSMIDYLVLSITDCVDYLEYMKYNSNNAYSLKGRTPESLSRAVHHWHHHVFNEDHSTLKRIKWDKTEELDLHFTLGGKQYACLQLSSGLELMDEGKIMKNCVITYAQSCANLYCTIWSLRLKRKDKFLPFLTIEVIDNTIVQARTKANSLPSDKHLDIIHDWAKRMNYKIDLYKND